MADTAEQIQYDKDLASLNELKGIPSLASTYDAALKQFNVKYPNGRPGAAVVDPTKGTGLKAATALGLTKALIDSMPDDTYLAKAWEAYSNDDLVNADKYWKMSKYYLNSSNESQNRYEMKVTRSGVYLKALETYRSEQRVRLAAAGVTLDEATFKMITEDAYLGNLSDIELDAKALQAFNGKLGGSTLELVQSVKEYGASFGIYLTDTQIDQFSKDIFAGKTTIYDIKGKIRNDAASAYPAYASQLKNGTTLDSLASAYKSSMANLLEIDPDSIDYTNPILRGALQYTNPTGGAALQGSGQGAGRGEGQIPMPLWQFEKQVKSDPRWQYTNNARDSIDSMQYKVLKDWGLM